MSLSNDFQNLKRLDSLIQSLMTSNSQGAKKIIDEYGKTNRSSQLKEDLSLETTTLKSFRSSNARYQLRHLYWVLAVLSLSGFGILYAWYQDCTPDLGLFDFIKKSGKSTISKNQTSKTQTNESQTSKTQTNESQTSKNKKSETQASKNKTSETKDNEKRKEYEERFNKFIQNSKNNEKEIYIRILSFFSGIIEFIKKFNFFKSSRNYPEQSRTMGTSAVKNSANEDNNYNEENASAANASAANSIPKRRFEDVNFGMLVQRQMYSTVKKWYFNSMRVCYLDPRNYDDRKKFDEQLNTAYTFVSRTLKIIANAKALSRH